MMMQLRHMANQWERKQGLLSIRSKSAIQAGVNAL